MSEIAYLFDELTRRPAGAIACQLCPITGQYLRPFNSLPVPAPQFAECIVVVAGSVGWVADLDASRRNALAHIDQLHADALRTLTGNATPEERDTWATKVMAARAVLAGTADASQTAMLGLEAAQKQIGATEMAQRVLKAAAEFETLVGMAAAFRVKSCNMVKAAQTVQELDAALQRLKTEMAQAMAAIQEAKA